MENLSNERIQQLVYVGISIVIIDFVIALFVWDRTVFDRFLGQINPLAGFLIVILSGYFLLSILLKQGWFIIYDAESWAGMLKFSGIAVLLGIIMMIADTQISIQSSGRSYFWLLFWNPFIKG